MNVTFGLLNLGGGEIILILALVLILFGAKKLPELARGMGQGIKEFKKATREVTDEIQNENSYSAPRNVLESKRLAEQPPADKAPIPQSGEPARTDGPKVTTI
jgi:sec-independent protein translocase protein TatA